MDAARPRCPKCGRGMDIARYRCDDCDVAVEGRFTVPPLARLSAEEQVFVTAFIRCHGNIKRMEQMFAISYPTVKNRLNAITEKLDAAMDAPRSPTRVIDRLESGDISVEEALRMLEGAP
ncbi:MAG: DUF2089 domain-containing protein [Planctomycetota bacterium]